MSRKISRSLINGRIGVGTGGQGLKVEWDGTEDGELHWKDVSESSLEYVPLYWYGGRGVFAGGDSGWKDIIDYITIATLGNAIDFGNLTVARISPGACSDSTRGVFAGGSIYNGTTTYYNTIDYITIASTGNASDFGNLSEVERFRAGCSDGIKGVFGGSNIANNVFLNKIDYVTIQSTGNSSDFGDLIAASGYKGACSGS